MATSQQVRGLYVIIDPDACGDRSPAAVALSALDGGARVLQWRDKRRDKGEQIAEARAIAELCHTRGAVFLINDHPDLVAATDADGVHLGQHDLPLVAARNILGGGPIIGVSTNNADEARAAEAAGASYVAVGAIFPTESKDDTRPASLERIREIKSAVGIPVVAIGGINETNIADVVGAGADAAAVISAVCAADDVSAAAATLASAFQGSDLKQRRREVRAIIEKFIDTLNNRDREGFIALFARDGIIQDPVDEPPHVGRDGIGAWWDALINQQNNYDVHLDTTHITGDEAAITWTISHRHDDETHYAHGVEILSFDGDLIASCHSYWSRGAAHEPSVLGLAETYARAVANRDGTAFLELFSDEAVQQDPVGTRPRIGREAISAWWNEMMATYSFLDFTTDHVFVSGREAAIAWRVAYDIDGEVVDGAGVDILGIDQDGRIASVHSYWESDEAPWVQEPAIGAGSATEQMHEIAHRFIDVVNNRDRAEFLAMFVEDCVAQVPYHDQPFVGIEGLGKWWDHAMPQSRHDLRLDRAHAVRDEVAVVWTDLDQSPGTITAPRGIEIITADHGRISGVTSYRPLRDLDDQRLCAMAEAYVGAINARDREAFLALWSEHGMRQDPPSMIPMIGLDAIGQVFDQMAVRFANHTVSIEAVCVAGNEAAIATRVESHDASDPSIEGVIVIALDNDGKIAGLHGYWESGAEETPRETQQDAIRDVVVRLIEILNSRHRDRFLKLVADDCVIQIPSRTEPFVGLQGAEQWWDSTIPSLDLNLWLDGLHIVGSDVVIVWSNRDRPPGSRSAVRGIDLLTIEGDQLSAVSAFRTPPDGEYSQLRAVAQAFTDALNARDREAFLSLWAKDGMRQDPPDTKPIIGLEAIGAAFDEMLLQFPDYTMSIETVCIAGNEAAIAWRVENRASEARPVVTGVIIIALDAEGKIASLNAYWQP